MSDLEKGVSSLLATGGRAEGSHRTERAPEVDVGQQGAGSQQQGGSLRGQEEKVMDELQIAESRRLRGLGDRQKEALLERLK